MFPILVLFANPDFGWKLPSDSRWKQIELKPLWSRVHYEASTQTRFSLTLGRAAVNRSGQITPARRAGRKTTGPSITAAGSVSEQLIHTLGCWNLHRTCRIPWIFANLTLTRVKPCKLSSLLWNIFSKLKKKQVWHLHLCQEESKPAQGIFLCCGLRVQVIQWYLQLFHWN